MKTFLEHNLEDKDPVYMFMHMIEKKLKKEGVDIEETKVSSGSQDGINGKKNVTYMLEFYSTGYFPDIRKMLDQIDSVLKPLNSYPDMIIMNWFIDKDTLIIKVIWENFKKTNIYKSLLGVNKYNL